MSEDDELTTIIEVGQEPCMARGYQVFISELDETGNGHGYRLLGPKICALGHNRTLATVELDQRDAREIFRYIRRLCGDDWLRKQMEQEEVAGGG